MTNSIKENKKNIETIANEITTLHEDVKSKNNEIQVIYTETEDKINHVRAVTSEAVDFIENTFNPIKEVILDEETGLESVFNNATDSLNNIIDIEGDITSRKQELDTILDDTKGISSANQTLQVQIEKMLGIASDKVLSKGLQEKIKPLVVSRIIWGLLFIVITVVGIWYGWDTVRQVLDTQKAILDKLFLLVVNTSGDTIGIENTIKNTTFLNDILLIGISRLFIMIPIFIFAYICFKEYSKTNNCIIKYEYKVAMASSLESYVQLLLSRFFDQRHEDKIMEFTLERIRDIYQEPIFSDKTMQMDLQAKINEYEMKLKMNNMTFKEGNNDFDG